MSSIMETIREGLKRRPRPGDVNAEFVEAVYSLFDEFKQDYQHTEWPRLDDCETMYRGDHWHDVPPREINEPRPVTPIIFSTIENLRADLNDEYPEAIVKPEEAGDELFAKVVTASLRQVLEATDYEKEYTKFVRDFLVDGWGVQETGVDATLNFGASGAFLRHVSNKNIMFDPHCADIQAGRAVFKFDKLPADWFRQHYPEFYPYMLDDATTVDQTHQDYTNTVVADDREYFILIEAWFRVFDPKSNRYRVHMAKVAGQQLLENSYIAKPEGYYLHGEYPFVVTPLYEQKGSPLGLGVVDMFKSAQQYSDKIDQIVLKNALTAGHNRIFAMEGSCDIDDLKDYSKEVIVTQAAPGSVMQWMQDRPLPSHIVAYMQQMRQSIKEESGSNDFSRGNVSSGVTAASAITALQAMSSKRSRLEAQRIHSGFRTAVRQLLEVMREFDVYPRSVTITINGEPRRVDVPDIMRQSLESGIAPVETKVSIKPVRQTRFETMAQNELALQLFSMFQGQLDPQAAVELLEFDGKEIFLEKVRAMQAESIARLMQQLEQTTAAAQQYEAENNELKEALTAMQGALSAEEPTVPETLATDAASARQGIF